MVLVTQDLNFAAEFADRILLLHDGQCLDQGIPKAVLAKNVFFSPEINRLFRDVADDILTVEEASAWLKEAHERTEAPCPG